jgi:hypothetical protein
MCAWVMPLNCFYTRDGLNIEEKNKEDKEDAPSALAGTICQATLLSKLLGLFFGHLWRVKNQITQLLTYRGEPFQVGGRGGGFQILIDEHD